MEKYKLDYKFWQKIGEDHDKGIETFATENKMKVSAVLAAAILERFNEESFHDMFIDKSDGLEKPTFRISFRKIRQHFSSEKLRILILMILVSLLISLISIATLNVFSASARKVVVVRKNGLSAYDRIAAEDIKMLRLFGGLTEVAKTETLVGRYVLTPIAENGVVSEENVLDAQLNNEMGNRSIILVPVKAENLGGIIVPESKIGLLFPGSKEGSKSIILNNLILLGIERKDSGITLAVAMSSEQLQAVRDILSESSAFVIKSSSEVNVSQL